MCYWYKDHRKEEEARRKREEELLRKQREEQARQARANKEPARTERVLVRS